jgi:hypothetical protein
LTELKHTEETMPSLSSGWFEGFKNWFNLHGYKIHGEAGSMLAFDQRLIDQQMNHICER